MIAREAALVRSMLLYARSLGCFAMKNHGGPYSLVGFPDLTMLIPLQPHALVLFVEAKQPGKYPTLLQAKMLRDLYAAGAAVLVAHSGKEVAECIKSLLAGASVAAVSAPALQLSTESRVKKKRGSP
jgi:hypothetical protein